MSSLDWNAIQARKHGVTYGQWMTSAFEAERNKLLKEMALEGEHDGK